MKPLPKHLMNNTSETDQFYGFDYPASALSRFIACENLFTILLKDGSIIHYTAIDATLFNQWLINNNIINIKLVTDN